MSNEIIRITLVGKTGNGKSSTGNSILRSPQFKTGTSSNGVTEVIQSSTGSFENNQFKLLDTPGVFDPNKSDAEITEELRKIIDFLDPGPHAFLLVLKANRFTQEDKLSVEILSKIFDEGIFNHAIIVFTGLDNLENDGTNLDHLIKTTKNESLQEIIRKCNHRFLGFNNRLELDSVENKIQVRKLFEKIETMMGEPRLANYYSSQVFRYSSQNIERRRQAIESSSNLSQSDKLKELQNIKSDVDGFFSNLITIFTAIRGLISVLNAACNII